MKALLCIGLLLAARDAAAVTFGVSADAAVGMLGEDWFADLNLRLSLDSEFIDVALQAPLALRLIDNAPADRAQDDGPLRGRDWDEIADLGRVIAGIRVGRPSDPVRGYIGPLSDVTLGHGSIIERYGNQIDRDKQRAGALVRFDAPYVSGEIGWSNVLGADLAFARAEFLPKERDLYNGEGVSAGLSAVSDFSAPRCLAPCSVTAPLTTLGLDAEYAWIFAARFRLAPYSDLNWQLDRGLGWHLGTRATLFIPYGTGVPVALSLIGEYVLSTDRYTSRYFTVLYDNERAAVDTGPAALPKAVASLQQNGGSGGRLGLELDFAGLARFGLFGEIRPSPLQGDISLSLNVPISHWLRAGALFFRRQISSAGDIFSGGGEWLLQSEVAVQFLPAWSAFGSLQHGYRAARAGPGLEADYDWMLGVRYAWSSKPVAVATPSE